MHSFKRSVLHCSTRHMLCGFNVHGCENETILQLGILDGFFLYRDYILNICYTLICVLCVYVICIKFTINIHINIQYRLYIWNS